jgi:O-antigen ligase
VPALDVTARQASTAPSLRAATPSRWESVGQRAGLTTLFVAAAASVIYLSFNSGGFFPNTTGVAAIVCAQGLVLRTTLAERPFEGFGWALNIPLAALALYTGWELASTLWAHAPGRALDAYDRSLLYLLAFTLFGSLAHSSLRLRWLIATLAAALAAVCVAGLLTRVLPHLWPTPSGFESDRLTYPLTYWNGEGILAAVTLILVVHLACDTEGHRSLRLLGAGLVPPVACALLLTFSRGGVGAALLGIVVYVVAARPRGLPAAMLALGPTTFLAVRAAYDANLLGQPDLLGPGTVAQGRHVAWITAACALVAVLLRFALGRLDRRVDEWALSRAPINSRRISAWAGAVAVLAVVVALALGGPHALSREYHRFVQGNAAPSTTLVRDRLTSAANNGRLGLWHAALHAYYARKLAGYGAGSYQVEYTRYRRDDAQYVTDAHSLYLQSMAELGLVGVVLIVVFVVGVAGGLLTRIRGPGRAAHAAVLAAVLAWAVHGLVDWDWQLPATSLWLFIAAGLALARPRGRSRLAGVPRNRTVVAIGWLLVAVAPVLISTSYSRVAHAAAAVSQDRCTAAKKAAFSSISVLAVRPQAYVALGICDLRQGFPTAAQSAMDKALTYNRDSWQEQYWVAVARAAAGVDPRAAAQRAYADNRYEPLAAALVRSLRSSDPRRWQAAAPRLQSRALSSGLFSLSAP